MIICSFCASSKRSDLWDNMLPKVICRLPKAFSFGAGLVPKLNILDGAILVGDHLNAGPRVYTCEWAKRSRFACSTMAFTALLRAIWGM